VAVNIIKRIRTEGLLSEIRRLKFKSYFAVIKLGKKQITKSGYLRSFYGPLMFENWQDITFRFCIRGSYGVFFSNFLKKNQNKFIFFDIGANQGLYSLIASNNPQCIKTYSFEPVHKTNEILRKNISRNGVSKKVEIIKAGIDSIQSNKRKISIDYSHSGSASINANFNSTAYEYIKTINRKYLNKLDLPKDIDEIVIKIDAEGNEFKILNELKQLYYFNKISVICFEYDQNNADSEKLLAFMRKNNFKSLHLKDSPSHTQYNIFSERI